MILIMMVSFCGNHGTAHAATIRNGGTSSVSTSLEKTLQSRMLNLPAVLSSSEEVYLIISGRAGGGEVIVVGRSSDKPSDLASRLDRIVSGYFPKETKIEYLATPKHSIAIARYSKLNIGKTTCSWSIPVSTIISKAKVNGLKPHLVFRMRPYVQVPDLGHPIYRTKNYIYYDARQLPADGKVNMQTDISISSIAEIIAMLSVLPLLSVASLMLGIRIARGTKVPVGRRRALCYIYTLWGVLIPLGYNPIPIILYLKSSNTIALLDLWFGRFSPIAIITPIIASYGLLALLLVAGSNVRRRHFSISSDGYTNTAFSHTYPIRFAFLVAGLEFILQFVLLYTKGLDIQWRVAALLTYFGISALIIRVLWIWYLRTRIALCKIDQGLTFRAQEIAERIGVGIEDVRIDDTADGRNYASSKAFLTKGHIVITKKNVDALSQEEVEWILARELAYRERCTGLYQNALGRVLGIATVILCLPICVFLFLDTGMATKLYCALILMPIAIVNMAIEVSTNCKRELAADAAALEATRNLPAAESALRYLITASENPKLSDKDTTHPALSKRLEALRQTAQRLGLS